MPTSLTRIFLSYPDEDKKQAYALYQRLVEAGFKPWMFSQDLQPGASTVTGPEQALRQSDLFLALLSRQSTGRKGFYEKEWQIALEVWKERGAGIFIIPVRLEDCKVPNVLKEFQAVDLFAEGGWEKLLDTLHSVAGVPLEPPTPPDELVHACLEQRCVLFVGSGLSVPAGYPAWTQFLGQLLDWALENQSIDARYAVLLRRSIDSGDTRLAADSLVGRIMISEKQAQFFEFLEQIYLKPYSDLPDTHLEIPRIGFSALITTNYDRLLEDALNTSETNTPREAEKLLEKLSKREFFIAKLYGQLREPDTVLAAPFQFEDMLTKNRAFANFMESLFVSRSFLFAGASLDGIFSFLDMMKLPLSKTQHYALAAVSGSAWEARAELLELRFGVKVLPYPVSPTHSEVVDFFVELADRVQARSGGPKTARQKPKEPLRGLSPWLASLQLTNIGPFESLDLDLTPEWNILLGDNGVGKSSILRAVALGLVGIDGQSYADRLLRVGATSGRIVLRTNKDVEYITELSRTSTSVEVRQVPGRPLEIEGWLALGFPPVRTVSWRRPSGPQLETTRLRPNPDDLSPILSGEPDWRLDKIKQILINIDYRIRSSKTSRERSWNKRLRNDYFGVVRQLTGDLTLEYYGIDPERLTILVTTDDGIVPIEMLSQGTVSLLGWVGALVERMYEVHDKSRRPLEEYALVLIDEIDAHMHPDWQQKLVSGLNELFPNVQFCATTHSPLIVGGLPVKQVMRFVRDDEGRVVHLQDVPEDMTMGRTDQVLTGWLFGLNTTLDPITQGKIKRYQDLTGQPTRTPEEQQELEQLELTLDSRIPTPQESLPERRAQELLEALLFEQVGGKYPDMQKSLLEKASRLLDEVSAQRGASS